MDKNDIKDRLLNIIDDADDLPIQDITVEDDMDLLHVYLTDGTRFSIHVEGYGSWRLDKIL